MQLFVRAVITGFGLALGAALYRKVARKLGIDEEPDDKKRERDGETVSSTPAT